MRTKEEMNENFKTYVLKENTDTEKKIRITRQIIKRKQENGRNG